ncbi:MAG: exopolysaccharide Pel transporter PelG [Janthinobacterium lividum]
MAGIGFVLRRLTQRDDLAGGAQAYLAAAAVTSGPWLLTVLAILLTDALSRMRGDPVDQETFRAILSYNFCFSLVLTSPLTVVATRITADRIFDGDIATIGSIYVQALSASVVLQMLPMVVFWGLVVHLPWELRLVAIASYTSLVGLWVTVTFLSVLKDFRLALGVVALGMIVACVCAVLARPLGAAGLLGGFTLGTSIIAVLGGARVLMEFPWRPLAWRETWDAARGFPSLAVIGLVAAAAPWADKWVMWCAPGAERLDSGLRDFPAYDSAMFIAYLVMVPGIAMFFVAIETDFFVHYRRYFDELLQGARLARLELLRRRIIATVLRAGLSLLVLEGLVAAVTILGGPTFVQMGWMTEQQHPIFRFGVLGALFHTQLLCLLVVLAYLDARRMQLVVVLVFLGLNAALPTLLLSLGDRWYGYGYFAASLVSLLVAVVLTFVELHHLNYRVFVGNNPSLRAGRLAA